MCHISVLIKFHRSISISVVCGATTYVKRDVCSDGSLAVTIFVRMWNFPLNGTVFFILGHYLKIVIVIFINMCM